MIERFLRPLIVAAVAALAVKLNEFLLVKGLDELVAIVIAVISSVTVGKASEFLLLDVPMHVSFLRQRFDSLHTIEGYWYERVNSSDHPFSYACIEFDSARRRFRYNGKNFASDMTLNATFSSDAIDVRREARQITFTFQAQVERPGRSHVRGYASVTFHSDGKRSFTRGEGSFVETDLPSPSAGRPTAELRMREVSFSLDKIATNQVRGAIGRSRVRSNADIVAVVAACRAIYDPARPVAAPSKK